MSERVSGIIPRTRADLDFGQGAFSDFRTIFETILIWSFFSFGFVHMIGGLVAYGNLRDLAQTTRWAHFIPVVFVFLGSLIPATAGLITALIVAGIFASAGLDVSKLMAMILGVAPCAVYVILSFRRQIA